MALRNTTPKELADGEAAALGNAARRSLRTLVARSHESTTRSWLQKHLPNKINLCGLQWECGSGEDLFLIASFLDGQCRLSGIDTDPVLIEAACSAQGQQGLETITFCTADPDAEEPRQGYDFVYARFEAHDWSRQAPALRKIRQWLKPEGVLIAELITYSRYTAYPYNHAFARSMHLIGALEEHPEDMKQQCTDLIQQAGFNSLEMEYTHPYFLSPEHHRIGSLVLELFQEQILARRHAAREELKALLVELQQYEQLEDVLIGQPAVLQVVAR